MGSDLVIGIDLGTTNSVVAVVEGDEPKVLTNAEGSTRTPSVVAFPDPNGPPLVGELAKRQATIHPQNTIFSIKRLMGRSLADVQNLGIEMPYDLAEEDGQLVVRIGETSYTPTQISAYILAKLKKTAEDYFGEPVDKAVITVPAYFDDLQRQATYEAGELTGLQVLRLLNEPTAAAMAYGLGRSREERVAVYDFGGGTFDLTLLDISNNAFEVLTSVGDTHLGGDDIDTLIVNHLLRAICQKVGHDFSPDAMVRQRLKEAAEQAKCELSLSRQATIYLPFLTYVGSEPIHLEYVLTRDELERMIAPLVERTIQCCKKALLSCNLTPDDIDRVVMVGGSCRIPYVQDRVEEFFGIAPFKGINPDEVVAVGAAMQGAILVGRLKEVVLLDVTPHSLGIEVEDGKVSRIIEKNSTIPIKAAKLFTTTEDNQEMVIVHVLQGEGETVENCRSLGKFVLTGIQQAKAGLPRIQVTFHINADGMVEVSAEDLATRQQKAISLAIAPGDEEPPPERKRRGTRRQLAKQPTVPDVVAAPPPRTAEKANAQIHVERFHTAAFRPLRKGDAAASPTVARSDEHVSLATKQPGSPTGTQHPLPDTADKTWPEIPHPSELEVTPTTAQLLEQLASGEASATSLSAEVVKAAQAELENLLATTPGNQAAREWLIRLLVLNGDISEATRELREWLLQPASIDPRALLRCVEYLEQTAGPSEATIEVRLRALSALGRYEEALELIDNLYRGKDVPQEILQLEADLCKNALIYSSSPKIEFRLGRALVRLGHIEQAVPYFQSCSSAPELRKSANHALALCYWKKGLLYLAWQKLQTMEPDDEVKDMLYRLALDMIQSGDLQNAREVLERLEGLEPNYRDVRAQLARLRENSTSQLAAPTSIAEANEAFANSRFMILEEINRGSMGVVYRARDKILDEIVALKVLNDYLANDPNAVERFKSEARAAKRLSHPHIVRIHDMFEIGPKKVLSMEYIEGRDLKTILHERGRLEPTEVVRIAKAVGEALAYAHELQIIHRDIKPANIMVTNTNQVKVTDFGIAKILQAGREVTRSGSQIIGTPLYMAPEQIRGDQVDPRTDIYSLGVTLYELLNGLPPFYEGNIEYHHLHTTPPPFTIELPMELAQIILRCLSKSPDSRFQSAPELLEALESVDL